MALLLLLQWKGEAIALVGGSLRGQAAKVGGLEVLRFGLAGTHTGSEPGLEEFSLFATCIRLCPHLYVLPCARTGVPSKEL